MVPAEVVGSNKESGRLLSVSLKIKDPIEIKAFRAFLKDEPGLAKCPHCGAANDIGDEDLVLVVDSPLGSGTGLQMASPRVICDSCRQPIPTCMMDYSAFPSVVSFVTSLRNRYVQLTKQKARAANG